MFVKKKEKKKKIFFEKISIYLYYLFFMKLTAVAYNSAYKIPE
jgi:hypothetical protein